MRMGQYSRGELRSRGPVLCGLMEFLVASVPSDVVWISARRAPKGPFA